jgi:hypothetical protein
MIFVATKMVGQSIFFPSSYFGAVDGSGIEDLGWIKIRIRDPE